MTGASRRTRGPAYFDSSTIAKSYVEEPGSALATELVSRHVVCTSVIAPIELVSAALRRLEDEQLADEDYRRLLDRLRTDQEAWTMHELGPPVRDRAWQVIRMTGSRTLDAIHLATALVLQEQLEVQIPFITSDGAQLEAADRLGLSVIAVE